MPNYVGNEFSVKRLKERFNVSDEQFKKACDNAGLSVVCRDGSNEAFNRLVVRELIRMKEPGFKITKSEASLYMVNRELYAAFTAFKDPETEKKLGRKIKIGERCYFKRDVERFLKENAENKNQDGNKQDVKKENEQDMNLDGILKYRLADSLNVFPSEYRITDSFNGFPSDDGGALIRLCYQYAASNAPLRDEIVKYGVKLIQTLLAKNEDYGNSALTQTTLANVSTYDSLMVRKGDKMKRLAHINRKGAKVSDETRMDALLDCAGYDILAMIELDKEGKKSGK